MKYNCSERTLFYVDGANQWYTVSLAHHGCYYGS